jgi:hypothetical protein
MMLNGSILTNRNHAASALDVITAGYSSRSCFGVLARVMRIKVILVACVFEIAQISPVE